MKVKILLILLFLCFFEQILFAGTTGKIAGTVKDASSGEPLPGVNILLEGTKIGAASDKDGYYVIINIPPGTYTISAMMMGYKKFRMEQVRVNIDLTRTIDISLEETVLEGEVVVVQAQKPLVQKDMTASLKSIDSDEISALPIQSVNAILQLQPGVVHADGEFHIRFAAAGRRESLA